MKKLIVLACFVGIMALLLAIAGTALADITDGSNDGGPLYGIGAGTPAAPLVAPGSEGGALLDNGGPTDGPICYLFAHNM